MDNREERWPDYAKVRGAHNDEYRSEFQHDRDRILYTTALRRLSGVTQVASAVEGTIFHNRLTHSLEVAQVARGIGEYLGRIASKMPDGEHKIKDLGGLNLDAVEAAALAHDLGHPPYGHLGEEELDEGVRSVTGRDGDGFEGNAQSFRIVTKLAMRRKDMNGLDLTRAVLNGILKYPWLWEDRPRPQYEKKWGAYADARDIFNWVRAGWGRGTTQQTLEAAIMDWADDITYALHDVDDFYRAGLIPLDVLSRNDDSGPGADERARFVEGIFARHNGNWRNQSKDEARRLARAVFVELDNTHAINIRYDGSPALRRRLKTWVSQEIGSYVASTSLGVPAKALDIDPAKKLRIALLKELTWHYVINGPELSTQRIGQRRIISDLFQTAFKAIINRNKWGTLPPGYQRIIEETYSERPLGSGKEAVAARLAADFVAGLTEQQAVVIHRRITGIDVGPVFGPLP